MSEPKSLKDLLKQATLPERIVSIVMDRGLVAEFQALEDDLQRANEAKLSDRRKGGEAAAISRKIEDVREKMRASTVTFKLRGMRGSDWRAMKAKHPAKKDGSQVDQILGADTEGLFNEAVRASIVEPEIDDEDWSNLLEVLTDGEWESFTNTVYSMNEEGTVIPFSQAAFRARSSSDEG